MSDADDDTREPVEFPTFAHRVDNAPGGRGIYAMAADPEPGDDIEKVSRFVLYSGNEVRYNPLWQNGGDVIDTPTIQLKRYRRNPVVLADHDPSLVIGIGDAKIEHSGDVSQLMWAAQWDLHPTNPTAILVAGQHARKIRRAASIGFMAGKGSVSRAELPKKHRFYVETESKWAAGMFYRYAEMYEGSSVAIPKDPDALQVQSWALEAGNLEGAARRAASEAVTRENVELVVDAIKHSEELRDQLIRALGIEAIVQQAVKSDPVIKTSVEAIALGAIPSPHAPSGPVRDWFDNWS